MLQTLGQTWALAFLTEKDPSFTITAETVRFSGISLHHESYRKAMSRKV